MSGDLHVDIERAVGHLAQEIPSVEAVCLFGSVARGDERAASDIDLLVLGCDRGLSARALSDTLSGGLRTDRLSIVYHTPDTLAEHLRRRSRFRVHLQREGEILFDRHGMLHAALETTEPVDTSDELRTLARSLASFEDLDRFGGRFLFALAHLYRVGRAVVLSLLAERGVFEFNQARAFALLADALPENSAEVERIAQLRPFAELTSGREVDPLPFDFVADAGARAAAARDAIRRLMALSEYANELDSA
ncbi:MAG: nucleotidyltransferase domain-containing protein [Solirubrobacteraceae bacterium]